MNFINSTKLVAGYAGGMKPDGRELVIVIAKGTWTIPLDGSDPVPVAQPIPLVLADEFTGEPGFSAPRYECDYASNKPRCDVLLNGSAHAPGGTPVKRVKVSLRVGSMEKSFDVVGNRVWKKGLLTVSATDPEPFLVVPVSYDNAFGGMDTTDKNEKKHRWYVQNHAGVGFHVNQSSEAIDGKPVPNTEETGKKITSPTGKYRPMALGSIGRGWQPRSPLAGTYDKAWLDNVCPLLPADFDEGYFQAAPPDQQIAYPKGGEEVELVNLTPNGRTTFRLPEMEVPVIYFRRDGEKVDAVANLDTIMIEPDLGRFSMVWRSHLELRKNLLEISEIVVGKMSRGWHRARAMGKSYFPSVAQAIRMPRRKNTVGEGAKK